MVESTSHPPTQASAGGPPSKWSDVVAGALVSLIALPLCLGIAMASGFPPIAGIWAAIVGGVVGSLLSKSPLTIKGPAAGLIIIVVSCVQELGHGDPVLGYRLTLGVCVVAGCIQLLLGLARAGSLGDFFPVSAVHGMLAAIGITIVAKQGHTLLGVVPSGTSPLALLAEIPHSLWNLNPEVATIGLCGLAILFVLPRIKNSTVRRIPAPMLVLCLAVPLATWFDLEHRHSYHLFSHDYLVTPSLLVRLPAHLASAIVFPDFGAVGSWAGAKYILMFTFVGTLESLLSAKAIDHLDPQQRRTDLSRDLFAVGVGNVLSACIGGLPMISEIVRSSANVNYGARSRWSNFVHGICLLLMVSALPWLLQKVPLAALAALLVYAGIQLASPRSFAAAYRVGTDQLAVFVVTVVATLATDLLVGVLLGLLTEAMWHLVAGVPLRSFFPVRMTIGHSEADRVQLTVQGAALFSNWLPLRKRILAVRQGQDLSLHLEQAVVVDHSVLTQLRDLTDQLHQRGQKLTVLGLDKLVASTAHPLATRRQNRAA